MKKHVAIVCFSLISFFQAQAQTQYASSVISFSSQYTAASWSAAQALGAPTAYPSYGDISTTWAHLTSDGQREFLVLGFSSPTTIDSVYIYQTWNPGAIDTVYLRNASNGMWNMVYQASAAPGPAVATILKIGFAQTAYNVDAVRIAVNSPAVSSWNEIDAVAIISDNSPNAAFSVSDADTTICEGDCVDFTDLSTNAPTSWSWTFTGASTTSSTQQNPQNICYPTAGTYAVSLTATNASGNNSESYNITVVAAPTTPSITVVGVTLSTGVYPAYQWYFNGSPIGGATGSSYTATQNGNYTVEVTGANGCTAMSTITNVNNVGMEEIGVKDAIIYPNPCNGTLFIQRGVSQPQVVEIVSAEGKVLLVRTLTKIKESIDLHPYANGTYYMRLHQGEVMFIQRINLSKE